MPTVWGRMTRDGALIPYTHHLEAMEDLPTGERLRIKVEKDRNGKFNAFYHLMLSKIVKAVNAGPAEIDIDKLKKWVKRSTGRFDLVTVSTPKGDVQAIDYHSTSFAKMGEEEFHRFAMDTADLIREEMAPWIAQSDQWAEIRTMLNSILPEEAAA